MRGLRLLLVVGAVLGLASCGGGSDLSVSVSAGGFHTCGITSSGSLECWGWDYHGIINPPSGSFQSVSAGDWHTCGVTSSGSVECWGDDIYGQSTPP